MSKKIKNSAAVIAFVASLAGCQIFEEQPIEEKSAGDIFKEAETQIVDGDPEAAAEKFNEVERLYPYSEWAKRSMIMSAFAYHEAGSYEESRGAAQRYIDLYPADIDAPYAQYLIALSYYDQIVDIGRDQSNTFQALQELRNLIERYPDSEYARAALLKFDLTLNHLAGKEMEIGRFYLKRGHYTAAINRFRVVVEDYQTTSHTAEALLRLIECYLSLGLPEEAQTAGAILGHNFAGSEWYADAYTLLQSQGLEAKAKGQGWIQKVYRQAILGKWL